MYNHINHYVCVSIPICIQLLKITIILYNYKNLSKLRPQNRLATIANSSCAL